VSKKKIWHIYYGTRGTAGAYVDRLQKAALSSGFNSIAFASSKYRFKTRKVFKFFFPITDRTEKRNFFIKGLRYFELAAGYFVLSWAALIYRPVVDINLIDDLKLTYYFYRLLKFFKLKICITCHDVLSHHKGLTKQREVMFSGAAKLFVHSSFAYNILSGIVGEKKSEKIFVFPFPSSPYEEIISQAKMMIAGKNLEQLIGNHADFFLFIGIVRKSKGIETLIDAWKKCEAKNRSKLVVAGKWSGQAAYLKEELKKLPACVLIDRYLNDEEFVCLIENSKFLILPYKDYAHSAVLFAGGWHGGAVILSDIDMFAEILPGYDLTFPPGNSAKLAALIDKTVDLEKKEIDHHRDVLAEAVKNLNNKLEKEIKEAYEEILK
jgi:glycosyltransferase involved in cell wall biosynthesis